MKKWFIISIVGLLLVLLVITIVYKVNEHRELEVLSELDNSLKEFHSSKDLAVRFIAYLNIGSSEGYSQLRNELKPKMKENVFKEFFYSEEYNLAYKNSKVELISKSGKIDGNEYIFKLDVLVKTDTYTTEYVYFVTIKNMVITKIERL